jgi:hypothetical protein
MRQVVYKYQMQNKFCRVLSNALSFRVPGDTGKLSFNPCCLYDDYIEFNYENFKDERLKYTTATDFLPGCSKCKLKEITHGSSMRTDAFERIPGDIGNDIYKLEVVLDTTCNAACIQCGPIQSSLWRKELKLLDFPESNVKKELDRLKVLIDIDKVKDFHFWGGEPLATNTHLDMIREIKDPSTVTLRYATNGSIFPDEELWNLYSKFHKVTFNISIDGIGDQFHYMRWPLEWKKVSKNLLRFKNECSDNTRLFINYCVVPLNSFYVLEMEEWLDANAKISHNNKPIELSYIRGEGTLNISNTPMALREKVWSTLGENHTVSNILREVPVNDHRHMVNYLDHWDKVRKLEWRSIFPEVGKFYD